METLKLQRLNVLLEKTWHRNPFYRRKWIQAGFRGLNPLKSLEELRHFPLTTRAEFLADQNRAAPLGTNLSVPSHAIKRVYHSSGTSGEPIFWGDTEATLRWVAASSRHSLEISDVKPSDRILIFLPFSSCSGPWLILQGAMDLGSTLLTTFDPAEACRLLKRFQANVIIAKTDGFLHLARLIREGGLRPFELGIEKLICSGSGLKEKTRALLELDWGASVLSRYGMTEAGSIAAQCPESEGLFHMLDSQFIIESLNPMTGEPVPDGTSGELVLTTLGRLDTPIVRYRTGDHMRLIHQYTCPCGRTGTVIQGTITRFFTDSLLHEKQLFQPTPRL